MSGSNSSVPASDSASKDTTVVCCPHRRSPNSRDGSTRMRRLRGPTGRATRRKLGHRCGAVSRLYRPPQSMAAGRA